jgi:hypothetical protein
MSSHFESGSSSEDNAHPELHVVGGVQPIGGAPLAPRAPALIPFERRFKAGTILKDEYILWNNFDIMSSVELHFQDPATRIISRGNICLFKRMFLAGLCLPFPAIARELLLFLGVAPSKILPNGWRYLFAFYILWKTVLGGQRITILEFFNIYSPVVQQDGTIAFQVRQNPLFI